MNSNPSMRYGSLVAPVSPFELQVVGGDSINFDSPELSVDIAMKMAIYTINNSARGWTAKEVLEVAALHCSANLTNQKVRREIYGGWLTLYNPKFAGKQKPRHLYDIDNKPIWWPHDIPYASANNNKKDGEKRLTKDQLEFILPVIRENLVTELGSRFRKQPAENQARILDVTLPTEVLNKINTLSNPQQEETRRPPSRQHGSMKQREAVYSNQVATSTQATQPSTGVQEIYQPQPDQPAFLFDVPEPQQPYMPVRPAMPMQQSGPESAQFITIAVDPLALQATESDFKSDKKAINPASNFMSSHIENGVDNLGNWTVPDSNPIRVASSPYISTTTNFVPNGVAIGEPLCEVEMKSEDMTDSEQPMEESRPTCVVAHDEKKQREFPLVYLPVNEVESCLDGLNEHDIINPGPLTPQTEIFQPSISYPIPAMANYQPTTIETHPSHFAVNQPVTAYAIPSFGDQVVVQSSQHSWNQNATTLEELFYNVKREEVDDDTAAWMADEDAMQVDFMDDALNATKL